MLLLKAANNDTCLSETPIAGMVPITRAEYDAIVATRAIVIDPRQALQGAALAKLDYVTGPRGTITRCAAAGVAVPLAWTSYVQALRAIANGTNTTATALPSPPLDAQGRIAYPPGT